MKKQIIECDSCYKSPSSWHTLTLMRRSKTADGPEYKIEYHFCFECSYKFTINDFIKLLEK